jgi:hypothetical protein
LGTLAVVGDGCETSATTQSNVKRQVSERYAFTCRSEGPAIRKSYAIIPHACVFLAFYLTEYQEAGEKKNDGFQGFLFCLKR